MLRRMGRALALACFALALVARGASGQGCPAQMCVATNVVSVHVEPRLALAVAPVGSGSAAVVRANGAWTVQVSTGAALAAPALGSATVGTPVSLDVTSLLSPSSDLLPRDPITVIVTLATR